MATGILPKPGQDNASDVLRRRYSQAKAQRAAWEALWQDCYDYALPARRNGVAASGSNTIAGNLRSGERLFDGTACDAADQLAAALLAQLTPPWSRWFSFRPGRDVPEAEHGAVSAELDAAAEILHAQFDRSNLAVGCRRTRTGPSCSAPIQATPPSRRHWNSPAARWRAACPTSPMAPRITTRWRRRPPGPGVARPVS